MDHDLCNSPKSPNSSQSVSNKQAFATERLSTRSPGSRSKCLKPIVSFSPVQKRYSHERLLGNHYVRLLRIVRQVGWSNNGLHRALQTSTGSVIGGQRTGYVYAFELVQSDLRQNCPPYKALSYTWGSRETAIWMPMVDGSFFPITKNLRDALRNLIHASKLNDSVWLWIDQICIDQNAIQERNHQVQIMGDIYKGAEEVIIWLGNWNARMDCISYLLTESPRVRAFYTKFIPGEEEEEEQDHTDARLDLVDLHLDNTPEDIDKLRALETLFAMSWFTRAWVVQEAAMAQRDTVLIGARQTTVLQLYAICRMWLRNTERSGYFRLPKADELADTTWLRLISAGNIGVLDTQFSTAQTSSIL